MSCLTQRKCKLKSLSMMSEIGDSLKPISSTLSISRMQLYTGCNDEKHPSKQAMLPVSKVVPSIAIVTSHCMCAIGCFYELRCMPSGAVVVSAATSCAIAARHELSKMPETTSTSFPHRANIIAIKHVLHRIYSQKTIIVWAVMTMEVVISILKLQESHISLRSLPANAGAFYWVVLCIMSASTLAHQAPPPIVRLELTLLPRTLR